jgi:hypothetical protein
MDQYICTRGDTDFMLHEVKKNQNFNEKLIIQYYIDFTANEILEISDVFTAKR